MRTVQQLVHARTRVGSRYALMPLEGFPDSRLPSWPGAQVKVLASPALGAQFVQYLIDLPAGAAGAFAADGRLETFYYVLAGTGQLNDPTSPGHDLRDGSFGLLNPTESLSLHANTAMRLVVLRKAFEIESASTDAPFPSIHGHESGVAEQAWADNPHALLQTLIPDELPYDLAMNIFTFSPGHGLPIVETHVMEHGLLFLDGKGLYYLGDQWMEVEKDDFIWMGPFCPQSFYATGPTAARYLYYKNVNREPRL